MLGQQTANYMEPLFIINRCKLTHTPVSLEGMENMIFLFLCLLTGALIIGFVKKYILRIAEPSINELWVELEEQDWFKILIRNEKIKDFLLLSKEKGLLSDSHFIRNVIDKEGHREGFIKYINEKMK
jgi:hypothetical protein